ncbi:hypothetical protein Pint_00369 [Pistacia integerrima]|uniref:Uncharacterized protein n=1 Tax=Pistacia integerrima TaxID=434235 RepID=A0ACC0ZM40_9ROSI|nr:hypothetical protein Pint_00369 [Pistacia integerrima]
MNIIAVNYISIDLKKQQAEALTETKSLLTLVCGYRVQRENPTFFMAVHAPSNEKALMSAMKCAFLAAVSVLGKDELSTNAGRGSHLKEVVCLIVTRVSLMVILEYLELFERCQIIYINTPMAARGPYLINLLDVDGTLKADPEPIQISSEQGPGEEIPASVPDTLLSSSGFKADPEPMQVSSE